jgi:hypothetical protein
MERLTLINSKEYLEENIRGELNEHVTVCIRMDKLINGLIQFIINHRDEYYQLKSSQKQPLSEIMQEDEKDGLYDIQNIRDFSDKCVEIWHKWRKSEDENLNNLFNEIYLTIVGDKDLQLADLKIEIDWLRAEKELLQKRLADESKLVGVRDEDGVSFFIPEPLHDSDTWRFNPLFLKRVSEIIDELGENAVQMEDVESVLLALYTIADESPKDISNK